MATATPTRPTSGAAAHPSSSLFGNLLTYWHLLSLDAPTVATLWTWFIARTNHIALPWSSIVAMAVAVWMLYAADRLMDARALDDPSPRREDLEARHRFHHQHRRAFVAGILFASAALALLLPRLEAPAMHLYLILGGLLAGYFIVIHVAPSGTGETAHRLPKEIAVGIFFAAAVFIPTVARRPGLRLTLLVPALLFATLCSTNCLFIYAWEHPISNTGQRTAHAATRLALRHLKLLAYGIVAAAVLTGAAEHRTSPWLISISCAFAGALLLLLHRRRGHIPSTLLRAAADLALLTPVLLAPWVRYLMSS